MRSALLAVCLALVCGRAQAIINDADIIARGDANNDRAVNVTDAVYINSFLFNGGPAPPCMNQADANHDGRVDGADAIFILNWLYNGGAAPPSPGPFNSSCVTSTSPLVGCYVGC